MYTIQDSNDRENVPLVPGDSVIDLNAENQEAYSLDDRVYTIGGPDHSHKASELSTAQLVKRRGIFIVTLGVLILLCAAWALGVATGQILWSWYVYSIPCVLAIVCFVYGGFLIHASARLAPAHVADGADSAL